MPTGNEPIVSMFKRKNDAGTLDPLYIGPDQKFVGPMRKSNNNNMEEQFLLGVDRIVTTWVDEETGVLRRRMEFRDNDDPTETDYYILDSFIYEDSEGKGNVFVDDDDLMFGIGLVDIDSSGNRLMDLKGNDFMTYITADNSLLFDTSYDMRKDILRYKKSDGSIIDVSQKVTTKIINAVGAVVVREIITNFL